MANGDLLEAAATIAKRLVFESAKFLAEEKYEEYNLNKVVRRIRSVYENYLLVFQRQMVLFEDGEADKAFRKECHRQISYHVAMLDEAICEKLLSRELKSRQTMEGLMDRNADIFRDDLKEEVWSDYQKNHSDLQEAWHDLLALQDDFKQFIKRPDDVIERVNSSAISAFLDDSRDKVVRYRDDFFRYLNRFEKKGSGKKAFKSLKSTVPALKAAVDSSLDYFDERKELLEDMVAGEVTDREQEFDEIRREIDDLAAALEDLEEACSEGAEEVRDFVRRVRASELNVRLPDSASSSGSSSASSSSAASSSAAAGSSAASSSAAAGSSAASSSAASSSSS